MTLVVWVGFFAALVALLYLIIGWCLVISDPEMLVTDVDRQQRDTAHGPARRVGGVLLLLVRLVATWPRWF